MPASAAGSLDPYRRRDSRRAGQRAPPRYQHHASVAVTDLAGAVPAAVAGIGQYELTVRMTASRTSPRPLTLTAGAAFEIPVTLSVATSATVRHRRGRHRGARRRAQPDRGHRLARPRSGTCRSTAATSSSWRWWSRASRRRTSNSTQLFPETSAVLGVSLSVSSQRNLSNNFIVDGLSANDDAAALERHDLRVDAIEQFQVVTSGGQAELGRALGGYVNVVTKSGTNVLHGSGYDYLRDDRLNARNPLSGTTLPMRSVAVRRQRWRADRARIARSTSPMSNSAGSIRPASPRSRRPTSPRSTHGWPRSAIRGRRSRPAIYPNPIDSTNLLAKVEHQVERRATSSASVQPATTSAPTNARGAGGLNAPSASADLDNLDRTSPRATPWSLSPRTAAGDARADRASASSRRRRAIRSVRRSAIAGVASFGTSSGSPTGRDNTMYQVVSNLSHQAGAHAVRIGVDVLFNDDRIDVSAGGARQLPLLVARELSGRRLQQRRLHADVRRLRGRRSESQRRGLRAGRVEDQPGRDAQCRHALRPAVSRNDQHRPRQRLAARRRGLVAIRRSPHDRARPAPGCSTTACRCGRSRTRCCRPATPPT